MFGLVNNERYGALDKHATSCPCPKCAQSRISKRDTGPHEEKEHLAHAKAMMHNAQASDHNRKAYGWDDQGGRRNDLPVEEKAKHLEAAAGHQMAADHYGDAARSYRDGLPKGAMEHEKIAASAGEKANKLTEKLKG
jgi:hypothetical protein